MAMKVKRSIAIAFERGKWGQMEEIDRATFPSEKPSDLALDGFVAVSFFFAPRSLLSLIDQEVVLDVSRPSSVCPLGKSRSGCHS